MKFRSCRILLLLALLGVSVTAGEADPGTERRLMGHVDVSVHFAPIGKLIPLLIWLTAWIALFRTPYKSKPFVALCSALLMIIARQSIEATGMGPKFDIKQHVPLEPLLFLFVSMLFHAIAKPVLLQTNLGNLRSLLLATMTSFFWIPQAFIPNLPVETPLQWFAVSSTHMLGSAWSLTGSLTNILVATLAYDSISVHQLFIDMSLPVIFGMILLHVIIWCSGGYSRFHECYYFYN
jgi:hypothetical protein